jgi:hypothetical protein
LTEKIIGGIGTLFLICLIVGAIYSSLDPNQGQTGTGMVVSSAVILFPSPFLLLSGMGIIKLRKIISSIIIIWLSLPLAFLFYFLIYWIVGSFKR